MRTVIEVDGLFDGTTTISDAAIVVEDSTITWVGKRSRVVDPRSTGRALTDASTASDRFG